MIDIVDSTTRSRMMSGIRGINTKPEVLLRKKLHAFGFRFRLHARDLPGRPDIVLPKHRAVILVHGCFWHRHAGCRNATTPANNAEFWQAKFAANTARDIRSRRDIAVLGWRTAVVWECSMRKDADLVAQRCALWLKSGIDQEIEM